MFFYQTTEGSFQIVLRTDSQAAKQISMMHGLLPRVRHLEFRVAVLQLYTPSGRLEIEFVPGSLSGSDALTKPGDPVHQGILTQECGLEMAESSMAVNSFVQKLVEETTPMSSQNRRRVLEVVGNFIRVLSGTMGVDRWSLALRDSAFHLDLETVRNSEVLECFESPACEPAVPGVEGEKSGRHVSFAELPEIRTFPSKSIPRRWNTLLGRYPHLEVFREQIALVASGVPVFVELCCRKGSCFSQLVRQKSMGMFQYR